MQRGTKVTDPALPVVLSDSAKAERAEKIARLEGDIENAETEFERRKKAHKDELAEIKTRITGLRAEVYRHAGIIREQVVYKDQSTLKFGEAMEPEKPAEEGATPTADESTAALAKVAEIAEPRRWHKDGALCKSDTCKRRIHVDYPEALRANGIAVEGDDQAEAATPAEPDERAKCPGCGEALTATEIVKRNDWGGLCETCHLQPPADGLTGEPIGVEASPAEGESNPPESTIEASGETVPAPADDESGGGDGVEASADEADDDAAGEAVQA